jgi:hypothetical protein
VVVGMVAVVVQSRRARVDAARRSPNALSFSPPIWPRFADTLLHGDSDGHVDAVGDADAGAWL